MNSRLIPAALFLACAHLGWSQVTTARFYGIVTDPSGSVVPGASIALTNRDTAAVASKKTDAAGEFMFDFLRVGTYTLTIEASGFKTLQSSGIELGAAQSIRRSFILEIGSTSDTVRVTADTVEVNTVNAEQRESFSTVQATQLPLARRNYSNLLKIGTGVADIPGGVRMNGLGKSGASITVDGTNATANSENSYTSMFNSFNYIDTLSVEAIQEVQVTKGVISAEYGQQLSGNVNLITRSGTNTWHGSAFENFQAEELNARGQFLTANVPLTFNQFGGAIGGPIRRDRLFVFSTYEGYRERTMRFVSGDVPTAKLRNEMLAAVPAYKTALDIMPLPNRPFATTADVGRFEGAASTKAQDNHAVVKGDIRLTNLSNLALTYTRGRPYRTNENLTQNARNWLGFQERGTANYIVSGPAWTSETRFGYNFNEVDRNDSYFFTAVDGARPEVSFGGRRFPGIQATGLFSTGDAEFNNRYGPLWSLEEKFAKHIGKHSLKFGGILTRRASGRVNLEVPQLRYVDRAELLSNNPSRFQVFFGQPRYLGRNNEIGAFLQDDWRVSPKLVVNLGVRYDFFSKYVAKPEDARESAGFFNLDGLLDNQFHFGPFRDPSRPVENDGWVNLGPRVGFSYNPDGRGRTVIRGGHSVMFGIQPTDDYNSAVSRTAFLTRSVVYSKAEGSALRLRYPLFVDEVLPLVTASKQLQRESLFDPHIQNPYSMNTYFGVQREVAGGMILESAFVGTRGLKYRLRRQFNEVNRLTGLRPNPDLGTGIYFDSSQTSSYYSWQSSFRKRLSRGFMGSAHYTWGKGLSYSGGDTGASFSGDTVVAVQDFFDVRSNYGPSAGDVKHNFVGEFLYQTPALAQMRNPIARSTIGGWQISGIFTARTGSPLLITQGCAITHCRPDYIGGNAIAPNYRTTLQYLNAATFARVPIVSASGATLRAGNLGNGALRLPGMWNLDFSLGKNFKITELVRFQIRGDMFNVFNHTNFSGITTDINSGNFGRFTNTLGARAIQLNARISF
ncbi:MAG: TonB-dependent receptor [Acidobacteria bacterium]|nr:TonB-dependent receptor [Acidobacteriota bacterium]